MTRYQNQIRALLSPAERRVFEKLKTPDKIQTFLDHSPFNFEKAGEEGAYPVRISLQNKRFQCLEGALVAAAALAYHGRPPLLLDLRTKPHDYDHVVALFKEQGRWGAISKTNHAVLRWRDPVYASVRELAMSYFHEYFVKDGEKTLQDFAGPVDLRRYPAERWLVGEGDMEWLIKAMDKLSHSTIAPASAMKILRRASPLERRVMERQEWDKNGKRAR